MANHVTPQFLIVALMVVCVTQAAPSLDVAATEHLNGGDVIAALIGVNRTTEVFGNSYKQAVFLYKDKSDEWAALKKLPELVMQLKNEIIDLKSPNKQEDADIEKGNKLSEENAYLRNQIAKFSKKVSALEEQCRKTLDSLADQLNIKKMVADYDRSKDWRTLRKGLESALDHDSPAYRQLQAISSTEGYPPWQIAFEGHADLVRVLVLLGQGINVTDQSKDNLLHGAVAGGQVDLVEFLLDHGAGIESRNSWGNAPLALACKYRRLPVARLLYARGADVDGINYEEKWAGLARAADNGDLEIVKFMVEVGASTTIKDRDGRTPLEIARRKGYTNVVEYLSQFPH